MIKSIYKFGKITQINAKTLSVNAYLIKGEDYLVVVDSLLLKSDTEKLAVLANNQQSKNKFLINTHFHSDHCLGNRIVKQPGIIQINHKDYWQTIDNEKAMINPRRYKRVDKTILTHPEITFSNEYHLKDISIIHTPGHSPDSACLYLPEEKALITGDTVLNNSLNAYSLPYFFWGDADNLIHSLQILCQLDIKVLYSGHGEPLYGKDKIETDLNYLRNLKASVRHLDKGMTSSQIANRISAHDCLGFDTRIAVPQVHELNIRQLINDG